MGGGNDLLNAEEKPEGGAAHAPGHVKLPKLEIRWFAGDPLEFPTFEQQFAASVGQANIADVAKFSYLKGFLRGDALRSIQGLSLTNENYKNAWQILTHRYGRKN